MLELVALLEYFFIITVIKYNNNNNIINTPNDRGTNLLTTKLGSFCVVLFFRPHSITVFYFAVFFFSRAAFRLRPASVIGWFRALPNHFAFLANHFEASFMSPEIDRFCHGSFFLNWLQNDWRSSPKSWSSFFDKYGWHSDCSSSSKSAASEPHLHFSFPSDAYLP